jgi:hypothetical protein
MISKAMANDEEVLGSKQFFYRLLTFVRGTTNHRGTLLENVK